jgi:hypothetical protein
MKYVLSEEAIAGLREDLCAERDCAATPPPDLLAAINNAILALDSHEALRAKCDRHRQRRLVLHKRLRVAREIREAFIDAAKMIGEDKERQVAYWRQAFLNLVHR